jgi:ribosomal protein L37AE/L43A
MVRRPLLLLLMGRVQEITGWKCTKCGYTIATGSRAIPAKRA